MRIGRITDQTTSAVTNPVGARQVGLTVKRRRPAPFRGRLGLLPRGKGLAHPMKSAGAFRSRLPGAVRRFRGSGDHAAGSYRRDRPSRSGYPQYRHSRRVPRTLGPRTFIERNGSAEATSLDPTRRTIEPASLQHSHAVLSLRNGCAPSRDIVGTASVATVLEIRKVGIVLVGLQSTTLMLESEIVKLGVNPGPFP